MARKTITIMTDDLDGGPADGTVTFALDGTTYEIDLCTGNATDLRDLLARYVAAGRPAARAARKPQDRARRTPQGANDVLRVWARTNGWPDLPARGRIPADVRAAYEAAQASA